MSIPGTGIVEGQDSRSRPVALWLRSDVVVAALLLTIALLSWAPRWRGPIDLRWDSGVYYILGTSLAQGNGYRLLNEPGEVHAVQYPPLVPVIIAIHQKLLGTSDPLVVGTCLKVTYAAIFLLFIGATYALLRGFMPSGWAFAGGLLCVFNFDIYFHGNQAGSELPFGLASLVFLLASRLGGWKKREIASGAAAVAAFFLRSVGIALFAAWIADGVLRREFRLVALRSVVSLACFLVWNGYIHSVETSAEYTHPAYPYQRAGYMFNNVSYARNIAYVDPFRPELGKLGPRDALRRLAENAKAMSTSLGAALVVRRDFLDTYLTTLKSRFGLFQVLPARASAVVLLCLGLLELTGIGLLLARRQFLVPLYILATAAAICSAPWPSQIPRYQAPIIPLLLLAFFAALRFLTRRTSEFRLLRLKWVVSALVAGLLVVQLVTYRIAHTRFLQTASYRTQSGAHVSYRQLWYQEPDQALDESIDWLAAHSRPGDTLASSMPHWLHLRTGLKTVMRPLEGDPAKAQALLDSVPVRYVMEENPLALTNIGSEYMNRMFDAFPEQWKLVHMSTGNHVKVYERMSSGANPGVTRSGS